MIEKLNEFTNIIKVLMEKEVACQNHKPASAVQYVIKQILIALLVMIKTFFWKNWIQKFDEFNNIIKAGLV